MTDAEFLRKLADDFGVAAAWGEHAATCKRLREIAGRLAEWWEPECEAAPSTEGMERGNE